MAGEYKAEAVLSLLPVEIADMIREGLRIALTNQPMTGVCVRADLSETMAAAFEAVGQTKYTSGLRGGTMVPVIPLRSSKVWAAGELFLKS